MCRLIIGISKRQTLNRRSRSFDNRSCSDRCGKRHRRSFPRAHLSEHARELIVDPIDHTRLRAIVGGERQWLQSNVANSLRLRKREERHVGIAKSVNRLHRIAH